MPTMEELLAATEDARLSVDISTRTITVPASIKNIGVESDDDVLKLPFTMPRYIGDIDLSTFDMRINYVNAKGEGDMYIVEDSVVDGDNITFTWLVGRHATAYKGNVSFIVCLRKMDANNIVAQEFNTTICSLPVLPGLETEEAIYGEVYDILGQYVTRGELEDRLQDVDISGKEDVANKVTSLNNTPTNTQYPSAKATVDYVNQKVLRVYKYFGSITLHDLLHAHTVGSGTIYNMLDGGSRTFNIATTLGTARYYAGYITFPFPLPGEGFVSVTLADGSTMHTYMLTNLIQTEYSPNVYSYKDVDGVLIGYSDSVDFAIAELSYTLSVNPGDNVLSTGYYWDNLSSYVDLSGYAMKSDVNNSLETKSNDMKLLNTVVISEAKQSVVIPGTDDEISYAEMPLRKLEIYTFVPKDDSITTANAISTQIGFKFVGDAESLESAFLAAGGAKLVTSKTNGNFGYISVDLARRHCEYSSGNCGFPSAITYYDIFSYTGGTMYHRSNGGKKPISQIEWKIPSNDAEKLIPVGSKIEIWGCS